MNKQNEVDGMKGADSTGNVMQVILTCIEQPGLFDDIDGVVLLSRRCNIEKHSKTRS